MQARIALGDAQASVDRMRMDWTEGGKEARLWKKDASLWTGSDEDRWLGWLDLIRDWKDRAAEYARYAKGLGAIDRAVVLGMGGSSLCPDVLRKTFGKKPGFPELTVLDSVVPAQVRTASRRAADPRRTAVIVSSKSGSTIEPNVLLQHFMDRYEKEVHPLAEGNSFIAITDPGSKLEALAGENGFAKFHGVPSVGGRYSAFSAFGMVPAAIMGLDVEDLLSRGEAMARASGPDVPAVYNPGVSLGVIWGSLALQGRDKLTVVASPSIGLFGAWLEQLVAESTGKQGKGIVPVDDERLGPPDVYGSDRLFLYFRDESAPSAEQDHGINALEKAGHPVVRISLSDPRDLAREFFRTELATAVAGSVLGINPFNQPDVEAAKVAARAQTRAYEEKGELPPRKPVLEEDGMALYAPAKQAKGKDALSLLRAHLEGIRPGDYFAINAFIEQNDRHQEILQRMRHSIRDRRKVATTLGYGPRFLHSTGQLHKGGPNSGVFLQITSDDAEDLPIPGQKITFGVLKQAQALGDYAVLEERDRRIVRVHLGADVLNGLERLEALLVRALR